MSTTRVFKSGNSQAVRIPSDLAYADTQAELQITRLGDVITISPRRGSLKDDIALLRTLPKAPPLDRDRIDLPERTWD